MVLLIIKCLYNSAVESLHEGRLEGRGKRPLWGGCNLTPVLPGPVCNIFIQKKNAHFLIKIRNTIRIYQ